MCKKVSCTCKAVVLRIKPIAFLPFSLPSPLSLQKLPSSAKKRDSRRGNSTMSLGEDVEHRNF